MMRVFSLLIFITLSFYSCTQPITNKSIALIIEKDNLARFEQVIAKINLDTCQFPVGRTALHYALEVNAEKITDKLVDDDFMLNQKDSLSFTPLLIAIISDKKEIVNRLIEKSVTVNSIDDLNGYSALHYAVHNNDIELAKKMLIKKANPNAISKSIMQTTPLHIAIENQNAPIAQLLVDHNALDTIQDVNNHTAIDLAIRSKSTEIMKLFYNNISKEKKEKLFVSMVRNSGDTDFLQKILSEKWMSKTMINDAFVFSKDTVISQLLLKKGARMKSLHSEYNYGAIHYAAIRGDTLMLDFLLKNGASVNQLSKNNTVSPLMYAAQLSETINDMSQKAGEMQINVNELFYDLWGKSKEKNKTNSLEGVKFLIANKARLNFKNKENENALYYANASFNADVATYLQEIGMKETKKFVESKSERNSRILNSL